MEGSIGEQIIGVLDSVNVPFRVGSAITEACAAVVSEDMKEAAERLERMKTLLVETYGERSVPTAAGMRAIEAHIARTPESGAPAAPPRRGSEPATRRAAKAPREASGGRNSKGVKKMTHPVCERCGLPKPHRWMRGKVCLKCLGQDGSGSTPVVRKKRKKNSRVCERCNEAKGMRGFEGDSRVCRKCSAASNPGPASLAEAERGARKCQRCGRIKAGQSFAAGDTVCRLCRKDDD